MRFSTSCLNSAMSISSCLIRSWCNFFSSHDSIPSTIIARSYSIIISTSSRSNRSNILFQFRIFLPTPVLLNYYCRYDFPYVMLNHLNSSWSCLYSSNRSSGLYNICIYCLLYYVCWYVDLHIIFLNE